MKLGKPLSLMVVGVASAGVLLLGGQYVLSRVSGRDSPQPSSLGHLSPPVDKSTPSRSGDSSQALPRPSPSVGEARDQFVPHRADPPSPASAVQRTSSQRGAEPTDANVQALGHALQQTLQRMLDENTELRERLFLEATQQTSPPADGVFAEPDAARADIVPAMERALGRVLPQLQGNADLRNALQEAAETFKQKGQ